MNHNLIDLHDFDLNRLQEKHDGLSQSIYEGGEQENPGEVLTTTPLPAKPRVMGTEISGDA